jgi:hypothetical protein
MPRKKYMSKGNMHHAGDMSHQRYNGGHDPRPYESKGKVFVKKAGMFLNYEFHNDKKKSDKMEWTTE